MILALLLLPGCSLFSYDYEEKGEKERGTKLSEDQRIEDMKHDSAFIFFGGQFLSALDISKNELDGSCFIRSENGRISYSGSEDAIMGIDVSELQGDIDWEAVSADGVHFAMIRAGRRGYTEGDIFTDVKFSDNYAGAAAAGLDIGVYFFSQAISVREAEEEAEALLQIIEGCELDLPVVFDWEIPSKDARTAGLDAGTLTACAKAFCRRIEDAGYTPMVYASLTLAYLHYSLEDIAEWPFWLAQYAAAPTYRYRFSMWQYTDGGKVDGIEGDVDLDLMFLSNE